MSKTLKGGTFTNAPTLLMRGRKPVEQVVLLWIWDHADKERKCWPSLATLSEECGVGKAAVIKGINALTKDGLITKTKRARSDGGQTSNMYRVVFDSAIVDTGSCEESSEALCDELTPPVKDVDTNHTHTNQTQGTITNSEEAERISFVEIKALWNEEICPRAGLAPIRTISNSRKVHIRARMKECPDFVDILRDQGLNLSDFGRGVGGGWKVKFDWLIDDAQHWTKFAEGNYRKDGGTPAQPTTITSPDGKTYRR